MPDDANQPDAGPSPEEDSFERAMDKLEAIIDRVESGDAGLEQSITEVEKGARLIARCRAILDASEKKIEELDLDQLAARGNGGDDAADDEDAPSPDPDDIE